MPSWKERPASCRRWWRGAMNWSPSPTPSSGRASWTSPARTTRSATVPSTPTSAGCRSFSTSRHKVAGLRLDQRGLGRDMMADDLPVAVLANDHPGYFHRQRRRLFAEIEIRGPGEIDQIGADLRGRHIRELHRRRTPARKRIKIGRNAFIAAVERGVRSVKERVPRIERSKRVCVEFAERRRPFLDDGGYRVVGRALHRR